MKRCRNCNEPSQKVLCSCCQFIREDKDTNSDDAFFSMLLGIDQEEKMKRDLMVEIEAVLMSVGYPHPTHAIKVNKKEVGMIQSPNWTSKEHVWKVHLTVLQEKTTENPCDFRWVVVKKNFENADEAKAFLKENLQKIHEKNPLCFREPD